MRVDIARAWTTLGRPLHALPNVTSLQGDGLEVSANVGVNETGRHVALSSPLNRSTSGDRRIVKDGDRLAHAKLHLFRPGDAGTLATANLATKSEAPIVRPWGSKVFAMPTKLTPRKWRDTAGSRSEDNAGRTRPLVRRAMGSLSHGVLCVGTDPSV